MAGDQYDGPTRKKEAPVQHTGARGGAELRVVRAGSRTVALRPSAHPSSGTETAEASRGWAIPGSRIFCDVKSGTSGVLIHPLATQNTSGT